MNTKYSKSKVDQSVREFNDYVKYVSNSDYSTFDSNFGTFMNYCENDEIMSLVCNQLKYDNAIFDKWWFDNHLNEIPGQIGSRKFNTPPDKNEKVALLYQICLKVNNVNDVFSFCLNFTKCDPHEAIDYFNKNIIEPMADIIKNKLTEIMSKHEAELGNKDYTPKEVLLVYMDYSTNVNGNVDIKGDGAVGEGAKIEKKSII
jgi:hypothetical protein